MAPICSSCNRTHKRMRMNGLCEPCYVKARKNGTLKRTRKSMLFGIRECATCKSAQPPFFKDLCRSCYRTSLGLPLTDVPPAGMCEVPTCAETTMAHGLCRKHYYRVHNTGDINHSRPKDWGAKASHPLYGRWAWTKKHGGRGAEWDDFWAFVADIGEQPSEQHRFVRINDTMPWSKLNSEWRPPVLDGADGIAARARGAEYQRAFRLKRPDHVRRAALKQMYGISLAQFNAMRHAQNDLCAICSKPEIARHQKHLPSETRMLAVDHDHETGKVRGLLCTNCNRGIGCFRDDPALLRAAIAYLEHHTTPAAERAA